MKGKNDMEQKQVFYNNKLSFVIPNKKANHPVMVYCLFSLCGKQYKISTGAKVMPQNWNQGKLRSKTKLDKHNNNILCEKINTINLQHIQLISYLCMQSVDDAPNYDEVVSKFFNYKSKKVMNKEKIKKMTLTELLTVANSEKTTKEVSKKQGEALISNFNKFLIESDIDNSLEVANYDTILKYRNWCVSQGNTIITTNGKLTVLQSLFQILSRNKKYGYSYSKSSIGEVQKLRETDKYTKKAKNNIALTNEEVMQLYNFNQGLTDRQIIARDIFTLECETGQRISDIKRLIMNYNSYDKEVIQGLTFYKQYAQKTETQCLIPINDIAKEIINKYNTKEYLDIFDFKRFDNFVNTDIKKVCKKMGWDKPITYSVMQRGEMVTITKPLCDLIHSHTARHTFVTNMCRKGITKDLIILCTGHKDCKMIDEIYNNISKEERASELARQMTHTKQQPQGGDGIAIMANKVAELAASNAMLQRDTKELKDNNTILEQGNKQLQEDKTLLQQDIEYRQYKDDLEDYSNEPEDVNELEKDRIESILNKLLDSKLITFKDYQKALKDPNYYYQLQAKFKPI